MIALENNESIVIADLDFHTQLDEVFSNELCTVSLVEHFKWLSNQMPGLFAPALVKTISGVDVGKKSTLNDVIFNLTVKGDDSKVI